MKQFVFVLAFCFYLSSSSQNLVPNSSFEDYTVCPNGPNQTSNCLGWYSTTRRSPDYFNSCTIEPKISVPINGIGFQLANTGKAYVGIYVFSLIQSSNREYVSIKLNSVLLANSFYRVKFYVSLGNLCQDGIKNIGAYLSQSNPYTNIGSNEVLNVVPQVENKTNIIIDTVNWVEISGDFKANGGEKYITLGNFSSDINTDFFFFNKSGSVPSTYYYIDDVSLVRVFKKDLGLSLLNLNEICPKAAENVFIQLKNEGVDTLDFTVNPVNYTAEVSVNSTVLQSSTLSISDNSLNPNGKPLAPDSSFLVSIGSIDFTQSNKDYRIEVTASLSGDEQTANNSIDTLVSSETSLGNVSVSDSLLCFGSKVHLNARLFNGKPEWQISNTGNDWQTLSNKASLVHQPKATTYYRFSVCNLLFSKPFQVEVQNPSLESSNMQICAAGEYLISPVFSSDVQKIDWYVTESSIQAFHNGFDYKMQISGDTVFYLEMASSFCNSKREAFNINFGGCQLEIPNIFTPNADGINDVFLYGKAEGKEIQTKIFNRWGEKIVEWEGNSGWDGNDAEDGVYYYLIKVDNEIYKGMLTLVR